MIDNSTIQLLGFDLDGTLYPSSAELLTTMQQQIVTAVSNHLNVDETVALHIFETEKPRHESTTKTLEFMGIDGISFFTNFWDSISLESYIHKNETLVAQIKSISQDTFILSNCNRIDQVATKLSCIGLEINDFSLIVDTVTAGVLKPEKEAFLLPLKHFNVPAEYCLYIGDKPKSDILAAKKVGMKTGYVGLAETKADYQADTITHLLTQLL